MPAQAPTLEEFLHVCREEFAFIVQEFGFAEVACSNAAERFCLRFVRGDRSLEVRGQGYGTTADCVVTNGAQGPLGLIFLVPKASRPRRTRRRDLIGQLQAIREQAQLARDYARDFFAGDLSSFTRGWQEWEQYVRLSG